VIHVMTVVGTRPELIRLSVLIPKLDRFFRHTLVHTGQNYDYELNEIFFRDLSLRTPDIHLGAAGSNYAETISNVITRGDAVLRELKPDAVLILGDTNSALVALPAKRLSIPIFHMEAGNRCFNTRVPEEINRKIIDHLSDINLPYTSIAREYLLREGIDPQTVICTGSPLPEVLSYFAEKISNSNVLDGLTLKKGQYFLVSAHREENVDSAEGINEFVEMLSWLRDEYKLPVILSTHPRTRERLLRYEIECPEGVRFMPPFSFTDYIKLQQNALAVLSDSGTITEESAILRFPAVNIRRSHERPEGMASGVLPLCGFNLTKIKAGLSLAQSRENIRRTSYETPPDYKSGDCSNVVINTILSYYTGSTHIK
jgi:UDP-N-acetylglucosamine 2-epimerase (non-hydrolysing)